MLGRTRTKDSRPHDHPTVAEGSLALEWLWPGAVMAGPRGLEGSSRTLWWRTSLLNLGPESRSLGTKGVRTQPQALSCENPGTQGYKQTSFG